MIFENLPEELPLNYYIIIRSSLLEYIRIAVFESVARLSDDVKVFNNYHVSVADEFEHIADLYPSNELNNCKILCIKSNRNVSVNNINVVELIDENYQVIDVKINTLDEYIRAIA